MINRLGRRARAVISCASLFGLVPCLAGQPHLVLDINPTPVETGVDPGHFAAAGTWSFFYADDGTHGLQPWITDGTSLGTFLWGTVTRPPGSAAFPFLPLGNKTYLIVPTPSGDATVWESDGTKKGSYKVSTVTSDPTWVNVGPVGTLGSRLVFQAMSNKSGAIELWIANGSGDPATHISSATGETYRLASPMVTNGRIYFLSLASDGTVEPWVSDGTSAGTKRLLVIPQAIGDPDEYPQLVQVGNYLIFTASTSAAGRELWRIDVTNNSVSQVTDIAPGPTDGVNRVSRFGSLGSAAVFTAAADGVTPVLWRTDGTAAGTYRIASVQPDESAFPDEFLSAPGTGRLIFWVLAGNASQAWATDGSVGGTVQLPIPGVNGQDAHLAGTHYYLSAGLGDSGKIWRTDGTVAGTAALSGLPSNDPIEVAGDDSRVFIRVPNVGSAGGRLFIYDPASGTSQLLLSYSSNTVARHGFDIFGYAQGLLYFDNTDPTNGHEVWTSDGSAAGTHILKNISPEVATHTRGSDPGDFAEFNGLLYFAANDGNSGRELWRSDGTATGTWLLKDLNGGTPDSNPTDLFVANGHLYFYAIDSSGAYQLWQSDGTSAGTVSLATVAPLPAPFRVPGCDSKGVALTGGILFAGYDGTAGIQLWKTDGTSAGTQRVTNIPSSAMGSSGICHLTALGNRTYFSAEDPSSNFGSEFWTSDGTASGTVQVADINPGPPSSSPQFLTPFADKIFFSADDGSHGIQLWSSDGTTAGTVRQAMFGSGPVAGVFGSVSGKLIVSAMNGATTELWATDGTATGSSLLVPGLTGSTVLVTHGTAFFGGSSGSGPTSTGELWVSDGTATGTRNVFQMAGVSVTPGSLADFHGVTMFQTDDRSTAGNLWRTDGTTAGTKATGSIVVGSSGATAGQNFFFAGDDGTTGAELWAVSNDQPYVPMVDLGSVVAGQSITGNLLTGASDSDGMLDLKTLTIVAQPSNGSVVLGLNGLVTYTSRPIAAGAAVVQDSFTFSIADNQGYASIATAQVAVTAASGSGSGSQAAGETGGHGGGGALDIVDLLSMALGTLIYRIRQRYEVASHRTAPGLQPLPPAATCLSR